MSTPVLFLAFSNDADAHLDLLKAESKGVFSALRDLDQHEFIKVHREESADLDELFGALDSFKDQVAIFHYGGHADGMTLRMEGGAAHAGGFAGLLGEQANLKLVFLNGCATRPQVEKLLTAGVKAVIATSVPIRDDKASEFAAHFYEALANRRTIAQAFQLAQAFLQTKYGDVKEIGIVKMRGVSGFESAETGDTIPWGLYIKEESQDEVLNWKLPYYKAVGLPTELVQYIGASFPANVYVMSVLDEMARYSPDIYTQMMEVRGGESVKRDAREYPEILVRNFPWPLGSQIRLLRQQDSPGVERLENLVSAYVRTAQLLYFILLSNLWEQVRRKRMVLPPPPFDSGLTLDATGFAGFDFLAKTIGLYHVFHDQGVAPYVAEYERVAQTWDDPAAPLQKAHAYLEQLRAELRAGAPAGDVKERCLTAEQALAIVLRASAFLANYRMLTVRSIAVQATRLEAVAYDLDLGPLNAADSSALGLYQDATRRRKARLSNSQSIVLARDEDKLDDCLNLSPFIIDKNTFVSVAKGEGTETARLAHIFMLSYVESGRAVYLSVDHSLRYALENERDRIHTDMTREDFTEGRNLTAAAAAPDPFGLGASLGLAPQAPKEIGVKVFQVLRDQLDACITDLGAKP